MCEILSELLIKFHAVLIRFSPHISVYGLKESDDILNEVIWVFSKNLVINTSSRHRFCIHVVDSRDEERRSLSGAVKSLWKCFAENTYPSTDIYARKKQLLEFILASFLEVAPYLKWSVDAIKGAYQESLKEDIVFNYLSKVKLNKSRTIGASLEITISANRVSMWVHFTDLKSKEVVKKHLIDTFEYQVSFFRMFNDGKWLDNEQYGFAFKNGMSVSISPRLDEAAWSELRNPMERYFYNTLNYRDKLSQEDLARWANF